MIFCFKSYMLWLKSHKNSIRFKVLRIVSELTLGFQQGEIKVKQNTGDLDLASGAEKIMDYKGGNDTSHS